MDVEFSSCVVGILASGRIPSVCSSGFVSQRKNRSVAMSWTRPCVLPEYMYVKGKTFFERIICSFMFLAPLSDRISGTSVIHVGWLISYLSAPDPYIMFLVMFSTAFHVADTRWISSSVMSFLCYFSITYGFSFCSMFKIENDFDSIDFAGMGHYSHVLHH